MEIKSFGIREKIIAGFLVLIIIFGLNGTYNLITINTSQKVLWEILNEKDPSLQTLNQFRFLVSRSVNYTSGLVYKYSSVESGDMLGGALGNELTDMKNKLMANGVFWKEGEGKKLLKEMINDFDKFTLSTNEIRKLKTENSRSADSLAVEKHKAEVSPLSAKIIEKAGVLIKVKELEKKEAEKTLTGSFDGLKNGIFTLGLLIIIIAIATSIYTSHTVLTQIKKMASVIEDLSKGIHPSLIENPKNDEVGNMSKGINKLISGLKETTEFAENIGKGNFEASFTPLSDEDVLGNSLIDMRNNLKKVAEEDKLRNWANEGYAQFSDQLRNNYNDKKEFAFTILSSLVKYLDANQGMFFVVNRDGEEEVLEEAASYAWNRRKFSNGIYKKGEGLAGQAWIEGEYIFMTDVPEEYVQIRSGIGLASPRCIIVVPLKYNEYTFGVLELASFKVFTKAEIEFILKLCENIAATLSNSMTAEKMKKLLEETQVKTQQLKEQEEEMRQNLEELSATQEDIVRRELDTAQKLETVNSENEQLKKIIADIQSGNGSSKEHKLA